jgi:hypothetical protein
MPCAAMAHRHSIMHFAVSWWCCECEQDTCIRLFGVRIEETSFWLHVQRCVCRWSAWLHRLTMIRLHSALLFAWQNGDAEVMVCQQTVCFCTARLVHVACTWRCINQRHAQLAAGQMRSSQVYVEAHRCRYPGRASVKICPWVEKACRDDCPITPVPTSSHALTSCAPPRPGCPALLQPLMTADLCAVVVVCRATAHLLSRRRQRVCLHTCGRPIRSAKGMNMHRSAEVSSLCGWWRQDGSGWTVRGQGGLHEVGLHSNARQDSNATWTTARCQQHWETTRDWICCVQHHDMH